MSKKKKAKLIVDGRELELDVIVGSEGERAIDISKLRSETGYITLDQGYGNTGSCTSNITFINGEEGILRYRGYSIEDLCEHSTFTEVCYLLLHNRLPTLEQRSNFSRLLNEHSLLHEDMRHLYNFFPRDAHPMNILGTMVNAMSSFYPNVDLRSMRDNIDLTATRLISKIRTTACYAYKKSIGQPIVYPKLEYKYCENFLRMMFWSPVNDYELCPDRVRGRGLMVGIEVGNAFSLAKRLLRRGLMALPEGNQGEVLSILPPLTISRRQLDHAVAVLGDLLGASGRSRRAARRPAVSTAPGLMHGAPPGTLAAR